jgi:hydrogenase expression/formation protein HypC
MAAPAPATPPAVPTCYGDVCITCSDQAVSVTVVELLDDELATVHTGFGPEEVSVALVSAKVGDTILVHAREAIAVIDPQAVRDPLDTAPHPRQGGDQG